MEHQHRFNSQPWEFGYIEFKAAVGMEWDPETCNGDTWDDAPENLESADLSELFRSAEVAHSSLSEAGIPFLVCKVFFFSAQYAPQSEYTQPACRLPDQ